MSVEDDQEGNVNNMEDNPEMRYECDFKIFIFRNIIFYDLYDEEWDRTDKIARREGWKYIFERMISDEWVSRVWVNSCDDCWLTCVYGVFIDSNLVSWSSKPTQILKSS